MTNAPTASCKLLALAQQVHHGPENTKAYFGISDDAQLNRLLAAQRVRPEHVHESVPLVASPALLDAWQQATDEYNAGQQGRRFSLSELAQQPCLTDPMKMENMQAYYSGLLKLVPGALLAPSAIAKFRIFDNANASYAFAKALAVETRNPKRIRTAVLALLGIAEGGMPEYRRQMLDNRKFYALMARIRAVLPAVEWEKLGTELFARFFALQTNRDEKSAAVKSDVAKAMNLMIQMGGDAAYVEQLRLRAKQM